MNEGLEHDSNNMPVDRDYRTVGSGVLISDAAQSVLYGQMQDALEHVAYVAAMKITKALLQEAQDANVPELAYARLRTLAEHLVGDEEL